MRDWGAEAQAAIDHIGAQQGAFSQDRALELIDFLADKGSASKAEMQAYGSHGFVGKVLSHVTTAVHGKGQVPAEGGWYRRAKRESPYVIDPAFAEAWINARLEST